MIALATSALACSGVSAPTAPLAGFVDSLGFAVAVARAVALLVADAVDGVDDEHAETATDRAIPVTASAARLAARERWWSVMWGVILPVGFVQGRRSNP